MAGVVIGVDPAKRSNTIEVVDSDEHVLFAARFDNSSADYRRMLASVKRWPIRAWAVGNGDCQTSSSAHSSRTGQQRTREGRWGRHSQPARLTRSPRPTLRTSHNPGSPARLRPPGPLWKRPLDTEGNR